MKSSLENIMSTDRTRNDIEAIDRRREEWMAVVNAGDVERYMSLFADEIVWFPPEMQAISGREAVRVWLQPFFDRFDYQFTLSALSNRLAGNWAIERGTFTSRMTPKLSGEPMELSGRYIVFWRRDQNKVWMIERYVDETNSAPHVFDNQL